MTECTWKARLLGFFAQAARVLCFLVSRPSDPWLARGHWQSIENRPWRQIAVYQYVGFFSTAHCTDLSKNRVWWVNSGPFSKRSQLQLVAAFCTVPVNFTTHSTVRNCTFTISRTTWGLPSTRIRKALEWGRFVYPGQNPTIIYQLVMSPDVW